ncbi:DUF4179 domain-containing protein [Paenibacillus puldeungensis]|uniref:DUF4179 domain-containing protein n=1 Tax=Paenibacillus puldeungensis TaxID=696536 RepID=A0ABW3RSH8_9BACL
MAEREELELTHFFDDALQAERKIDEMKLETAVRNGLNRGKQARRKRQLSQRWGIAGGLAFCMVLVIAFWQYGYQATPAAVMGSQGDIPDYVRSMLTTDMERAADHGLYQPINQTVEKDGYKVTVDGVLADSRTAIIFYTSENTLRDFPIDVQGYTPIQDANVSSTEMGPKYYESADHKSSRTGPIMHTFVKLQVSSQAARGKILFSGSWGEHSEKKEDLKKVYIPIELDKSKYADLERTIPINETAQFGDHKVTIKNMVLRPLGTTINIESIGPSTDKLVKGIQDTKLYLGEERASQFQYFLTPNQNESSYQSSLGRSSFLQLAFRSIFYDDYSEAALKAAGITETTSNKSKLVIDTAKKQILSGGQLIQKLDIVSGKESVDIKLRFNKTSDNNNHILENASFTDKSGAIYTITRGDSRKEAVDFSIAPSDYAQPLTFTLENTSDKNIYKPLEVKINLK